MEPNPRCINLDWLEVFALEIGDQHDASYFRRAGFSVQEREYGTRIYHEMFTLIDAAGHPFIEIRRNPKNPLLLSSATHIRLHNRTCYYHDAANVMLQFLHDYDYQFMNISRIDICLDLVRFDDNTRPRVFMQRYMRGKFSKINQSNIHAHGTDNWTGRVWNSVSWGSPSSPIGTKFYNKTLELYDPKTDSYGKPYIRQAWLEAGLIDDVNRCTLKGETQEIWRVEFSIRSSVKRWVAIELNGKAKHYQSLRNTLEQYDSREKLLVMFASLAQHYFHFKRYIMEQRKDRCPDRQLFKWQKLEHVYKVEHPDLLSEEKAPDALMALIKQLRRYCEAPANYETKKSAETLLHQLQQFAKTSELCKPWTYEKRLAYQQLLARRADGYLNDTIEALMNEIKTLMHIHDNTIIF